MRKLLSTCEPCVRTGSRCLYWATCYLLGYLLPTELLATYWAVCYLLCTPNILHTPPGGALPAAHLPPSSFRRACTKPAGAAHRCVEWQSDLEGQHLHMPPGLPLPAAQLPPPSDRRAGRLSARRTFRAAAAAPRRLRRRRPAVDGGSGSRR